MLGLVGRPSRSVLSGQQSLPQCRVCSEGPLVVSREVSSPSRSVGSGRYSLPECLEWLVAFPECRVWSKDPLAVSGVVVRPF